MPRREEVVEIGKTMVAMATVLGTAPDSREASQSGILTCRTTVVVPESPWLSAQRKQIEAVPTDAGTKALGEVAGELSVAIRYTVGLETTAKPPVPTIWRVETGPGNRDAGVLLRRALKLDELNKIAAGAELFLGRWRGSLACDGEVTAAFPGYPPPADWVAAQVEDVTMNLESGFSLPAIALTKVQPMRPIVWRPKLIPPVLQMAIPRFDELARVTDGNSPTEDVRFETSPEADVVIRLAGSVAGDRMTARGHAELGAGVLLSRKACTLRLQRVSRL